MSSLPATVYQRYLADYQDCLKKQAAISSQIDALLTSDAESFDITSGDGRHSVKRRSLKELDDLYDRYTAKIRWFEQKLYGRGITNLNLRRK